MSDSWIVDSPSCPSSPVTYDLSTEEILDVLDLIDTSDCNQGYHSSCMSFSCNCDCHDVAS